MDSYVCELMFAFNFQLEDWGGRCVLNLVQSVLMLFHDPCKCRGKSKTSGRTDVLAA